MSLVTDVAHPQAFYYSGLTNVISGPNAIAQGTGVNQRIGRQISLKSISFRWQIGNSNYSYTDANLASPLYDARPGSQFIYKWAVVLDTQCNGAIANFDDYIVPPANNVPIILGYRNLDETGRFKTLKSGTRKVPIRYIAVPQTAQYGAGTLIPYVEGWVGVFNDHADITVPMKGMKIQYSGATGAVSELKSNNIVLFVWWDDAMFTPLAGNELSFDIQTRTRFTDS